MARRPGRAVGRRQAGRKFVWARRDLSHIVPAQDTSHLDLLTDFFTDYGANLVGSTIVRLRGLLNFEPASAATAVCSAGVIVGSKNVYNAIATGDQTGGPQSDDHADWMAYQPVLVNDAAPGYDGQIFQWDIDVKSARKMEEVGDGLFLVIENTIVGVTLLVDGIVSIGIKLP